jgi:hypothetical protein
MRFLSSALAAMGFCWFFDKSVEGRGGISGSASELVKNEVESQPRGIRNNNPLNIRYNSVNNWKGQVSDDGGYVVFDTVENGLRAAALLLNRYYVGYGLKSVSGIIRRWAPAFENDTSAYVGHVSSKLRVLPGDILLWPSVMPALIDVMIQHENGKNPYSTAQIERGIAQAGIS